jgi:hypothetical protein
MKMTKKVARKICRYCFGAIRIYLKDLNERFKLDC